jgi:hypothetical protein
MLRLLPFFWSSCGDLEAEATPFVPEGPGVALVGEVALRVGCGRDAYLE